MFTASECMPGSMACKKPDRVPARLFVVVVAFTTESCALFKGLRVARGEVLVG